VPHLIPRKDWWKNADYGFEDGVYLVNVSLTENGYQLSPEKLKEIWMRAGKRVTQVWEREIEAKRLLARLVKTLHPMQKGF